MHNVNMFVVLAGANRCDCNSIRFSAVPLRQFVCMGQAWGLCVGAWRCAGVEMAFGVRVLGGRHGVLWSSWGLLGEQLRECRGVGGF